MFNGFAGTWGFLMSAPGPDRDAQNPKTGAGGCVIRLARTRIASTNNMKGASRWTFHAVAKETERKEVHGPSFGSIKGNRRAESPQESRARDRTVRQLRQTV